MNRAFTKAGDYKQLHNKPCLNMVTHIINHYKRSQRRLKTIHLDKSHWSMINKELKQLLKGEYSATDRIEFEGCDVGIELGSALQITAVRYSFDEGLQAPVPFTKNKTKKQAIDELGSMLTNVRDN